MTVRTRTCEARNKQDMKAINKTRKGTDMTWIAGVSLPQFYRLSPLSNITARKGLEHTQKQESK